MPKSVSLFSGLLEDLLDIYLFLQINVYWALRWLTLCINLTGHQVPRWSTVSGCVCEGVSDETGIWIYGLSKLDFPPQYGWASSDPLRTEQKMEERIHPFFPAPLHTLGPIFFLLWPSDRDLHHQPPCSQDFGCGLNYNPAFPGSPACRQYHPRTSRPPRWMVWANSS